MKQRSGLRPRPYRRVAAVLVVYLYGVSTFKYRFAAARSQQDLPTPGRQRPMQYRGVRQHANAVEIARVVGGISRPPPSPSNFNGTFP